MAEENPELQAALQHLDHELRVSLVLPERALLTSIEMLILE